MTKVLYIPTGEFVKWLYPRSRRTEDEKYTVIWEDSLACRNNKSVESYLYQLAENQVRRVFKRRNHVEEPVDISEFEIIYD